MYHTAYARAFTMLFSLLSVCLIHAEKPYMIIPLIGFEHTSLDDIRIENPLVGVIAQTADGETLQAVGLYGLRIIDTDDGDRIPDTAHSVSLMVTGKNGRNRYLGIFKSDSDEPVVGGISTFKCGAAYGHDIIATDSCALTFGGGIVVGDFDLQLPGGTDVYALPVPFVRFRYANDACSLSFDFLTGPNFSVVIGPKSRARLTGEVRIDQMRDARDVLFDAAVQYRLFDASSKLGDFASVSLGFRNADAGIDRANGDSVSIQYLAPYAKLDLGIAQITGGYAFAGRAITDTGAVRTLGDGAFIGVQGIIPIGSN